MRKGIPWITDMLFLMLHLVVSLGLTFGQALPVGPVPLPPAIPQAGAPRPHIGG